jgi:hypothetical protein
MPRESNTFTRLSMLIGPMLPKSELVLPAITRGKIGGAAGNRTRVQSAYFVRVYLHSRANPTPINIGGDAQDLKKLGTGRALTAGSRTRRRTGRASTK